MPYGTLYVYVEGAVQIVISGKGSLYCTLTVGTQVFSSPRVKGAGTCPYFNTKFEFQVDRTTNELMVRIYSKKAWTDDDLLGYRTIFFKDAFYHSHVVPVTRYALMPPPGRPGGVGGHIRLSLTFKAQMRPAVPPQPRPAAEGLYRSQPPKEPPPGVGLRAPGRGRAGPPFRRAPAMGRAGPPVGPGRRPAGGEREGANLGGALMGSLGSLLDSHGDGYYWDGGYDDESYGDIEWASYGIADEYQDYSYKMHEAVASSSGYKGMEEYVVPNKKVQSKPAAEGLYRPKLSEGLRTPPGVGLRAPGRGRAGPPWPRAPALERAGPPVGRGRIPAGGEREGVNLGGALVGSVGSLLDSYGDGYYWDGGYDDESYGHVELTSYGSADEYQGYPYKMHEAVASSSGYKGMEEYVVAIKKVQSKDLKSGRLVGKGPSSIVYETTFEGKRYARKDFLRVPSDIFEKEAAALVDLDHPNVLRTYCWTVDEGSCSLVLELMDDDLLNMMQTRKDSQRRKSYGSGSASHTSHLIDLHKFIEDGKNAPIRTASESVAMPPVYPFSMPEALQIMLQIAEGMKFLHDKGVVHGDLKPKNILVTPSGRAASSSPDQNMAFNFKVADFGLIGTKLKSRSLVSCQARKLEMARWRAPELLDNLSYLRENKHKSSTDSDWDSDSSDGIIGVHVQNFPFWDMARADVYNFGLTCSQILHGEYPRSGLGVTDLVNEITLLGVRPELPPTCPGRLSDLIQLCWGEKTERPTFQDILSELKDLQASFTRTGSPVDIKYDNITGTSFERINSSELELVPQYYAVSRQSSGTGSTTSFNSLVGTEIDLKVGVPIGREKNLIEDIQDAWEDVEDTEGPKVKVPQRFSSYDIKRMTNNFNDDNVVGGRSFKVYMGIQAGTGATVAVKRALKGSTRGAIVFKNEIEILSRIHHNKVVGLVGFCFEKAEQVLVYEWDPANGTLTDWLRGPKSDSPLNWDVRLQIALGAAQGLAYLHDHAHPPIIHRDVKPSNILLDEKMNAKIAHFGLSLSVPDEANGSREADIAGSRGYIDPEYRMTGVVSTKSDVYGYGMVLLDLLTGRHPFIFTDNHQLMTSRPHEEVRNRVKHGRVDMSGIRKLIDPALAGTREGALRTFVLLACCCVEDSALVRPSMHEVVKRLELVGRLQDEPSRESHQDPYTDSSSD